MRKCTGKIMCCCDACRAPFTMTAELRLEAVGWLADCGFSRAGYLTNGQLRRLVDREREGGWAAFLVNCS